MKLKIFIFFIYIIYHQYYKQIFEVLMKQSFILLLLVYKFIITFNAIDNLIVHFCSRSVI